jgi:sugar/nucleoside kinase (ribokinase family)
MLYADEALEQLPPDLRIRAGAGLAMGITVVGSVAFDALETPFGKRERILGGAATHFSLAASFFDDVRVVGVVGEDFGEQELRIYRAQGINTDDLERLEHARSFFWAGRYEADLEVAHTLDTQLNVFADFQPKLSAASRACSVLFLANIQPDLQKQVREQCNGARFVGLDSMNYWIDSARDSLIETMGGVSAVFLNDAEVRMLTGEPNLVRAARAIRAWGPRTVVVKQGRYGACLFNEDSFFSVPGYPLETVIDPTGAGDAFAGGFLGYLSSREGSEVSDAELRCAMVFGSIMGSFSVEAFGSERLQALKPAEIHERFEDFKRITHFEVVELEAAFTRS